MGNDEGLSPADRLRKSIARAILIYGLFFLIGTPLFYLISRGSFLDVALHSLAIWAGLIVIDVFRAVLRLRREKH